MTIVSSPDLHQHAKFLVSSASTHLQEETEDECRPYFIDLSKLPPNQLDHLREEGLLSRDDPTSLDIRLVADRHIRYLEQTWDPERNLRMSFVSLDSSRPWMLYWTLHGCDLLNHAPSDRSCQLILNTLQACWSNVTESSGGFGGGINQMPHAATTYAAVMALCILASQSEKEFGRNALQYLREIREPLFRWMMSLREEPSPRRRGVAIRMHHDGEMDVRASYCVVAVAKILGLLRPELVDGVADYLISCQTYEGGFGGEPWAEAHGGYTYCASAALFLLGRLETSNSTNQFCVDVKALTQWLTARQMSYEGGFNGRSNKLVDGCYSFWQGGAVSIVSVANVVVLPKQKTEQNFSIGDRDDPWLDGEDNATTTENVPSVVLMDEGMLERYILLCAQDVSGGLRDKPSKRRDFYHSCYCLSGLSVAQHWGGGVSFGHPTQTRVARTHPCYNIRTDRVLAIRKLFQTSPPENNNNNNNTAA